MPGTQGKSEVESPRTRGSSATLHALIVTDSRLKTIFGWSPLETERGSAAGGVRPVAASTMGKPRRGFWSYKTARTAEMQKCFERTRQSNEYATL